MGAVTVSWGREKGQKLGRAGLRGKKASFVLWG